MNDRYAVRQIFSSSGEPQRATTITILLDNIDHVATRVRRARALPDPVKAALDAGRGELERITVHLRRPSSHSRTSSVTAPDDPANA